MIRDHAACVERYCDGVLDGSIVAGRFVQLAVHRHLDDLKHDAERGLYFNERIAAQACEFIEACCSHVKAEWAGSPLRLSPSQQFIVWNLQGWRRKEDGLRRFRKAYVTCGRKWGKSLFASAMAALLLVFDQPIEPGAEAYSLATTEEQAKIVYDAFETMVARSPGLSTRAKQVTKQTTFQGAPFYDSYFRPLGSDSKSKDGLNPHFVVADELHAWTKHYRKLWEKMTTGGGSRRQPLTLIITTAGDETSQLWQEQDDLACRTLDGVETGELDLNDALFAFVARIDEDDDPYDEACWPKANPNMFEAFPDSPGWVEGIGTPKIGYLRERADEAKLSPNELNALLRYHCNVRVSSTEKAITHAAWAQGNQELQLPFITSFGGFDLGRSDDWAAVSILSKLDGEGDNATWQLFSRSFVAEHGSIDLKLHPFREWVNNGLIEICHGDSVDFRRVEEFIVEVSREYGVQSWDFDSTFAAQLAQTLANEYGIETHPFFQRSATYNEPLRSFLRAVRQGRIIHGGDPVLSWQAQNLIIRRDSKDQWMPAKDESEGKIDAIVAALMGYGGAMFNEQIDGGLVVI